MTGLGPIPVRQPRVRHRDGQRFSSAILPKYLRRVPSVDALIPALYLKGVSTGDFSEALAAILGENASGLSATNLVRLKAGCEADYQAWRQRDLSQQQYVYWWADGIYFNVRLEDARPCVLVGGGRGSGGRHQGVAGDCRWVPRKQRLLGRSVARPQSPRPDERGPNWPSPTVPLVFGWRCRKRSAPRSTSNGALVHKTANVLDKLPKSLQGRAKELLHGIYLAPAHQDALQAYDRFLSQYQLKYPKACECLQKDKDTLFSFYHFPAEHWAHLRTTNLIEST